MTLHRIQLIIHYFAGLMGITGAIMGAASQITPILKYLPPMLVQSWEIVLGLAIAINAIGSGIIKQFQGPPITISPSDSSPK